jgi:nesprin-1
LLLIFNAGTQKVWTNYKEQKDEILKLLEQAEGELKKVAPGTYDSQKVAADLQAKQDMSVALRKATEEMLRKLRDLCSTLSTMTAPERKPLLQKEVCSLKEYLET